MTPAKGNLGKVLFFEEQMSSPRTVACATCHQVSAGGSDPRSVPGDPLSINSGPDGIVGTPDDSIGSRGVPPNSSDGAYRWVIPTAYREQVTPRKAPSTINAAYSPLLFWDGRAGPQFLDPLSSAIVLLGGGALEAQALAPPVSEVEMAHQGRNWQEVAARIATVRPLALSPGVPPALGQWIDGRDYPSLFAEAFGSPEVTPVRIAMAIATYERTLFSNQTPFDAELAGQDALTTQERTGRALFNSLQCNVCHAGNRLTDEQFHFIGVRPATEDSGRFGVTGLPEDIGAFKTPGLRNVELRAPYMHDGSLATLEDVVDFYDRGGDFNAPHKHPLIVPLGLSPQQKADLVAFMKRPLTDPRIVAGIPPFDPVALYSASNRVPRIGVDGTTGTGGFVPQVVAIEPPLVGNPAFTVCVERATGGTTAVLILDDAPIPASSALPKYWSLGRFSVVLDGSSPGQGYASVTIPIPDESTLVGKTFYGRWFVLDPGAADHIAHSPSFEFTVFGDTETVTNADSHWLEMD